jgi:hypothetical protein
MEDAAFHEAHDGDTAKARAKPTRSVALRSMASKISQTSSRNT